MEIIKMKNDKINTIKHTIGALVGQVALSASLLLYASGCSREYQPVDTQTKDEIISTDLERLKWDRDNFSGAKATGIQTVDDFIEAYINGGGTITCKDSRDSTRFYNLRYDRASGFVISPAPTEARGSHYSGNIEVLLKGNNSKK